MKVLNAVYGLLTRGERLRLLGLAAAMTVAGVVEMVGVASVLPFMQLVAEPDALERDTLASAFYTAFAFSSASAALFALGLVLLGLIALNNVLSGATQWMTQRYAWAMNHRLSTELLSSYLRQDYTFFLGRNTSDLNRTLLQAVHSVVTGVVLPCLQVVARGITACLIVLVLAAVDLRLAILLGLVFGGAYGIVYGFVRRSQHRLGWEQFENDGRRFLIAQEALGGIKDVKAFAREDEFMRRFEHPSKRYSIAAAHNQIVSRVPRYALETVAFGGILVILLVAIRRGQGVSGLLPTLTLYAFAGYRLMPALNELFSSVIQIRFNTAAVQALVNDLAPKATPATPADPADPASPASPAEEPVGVRPPRRGSRPSLVAFRGVTFRYPGAERDTLTDVWLDVEPRQVVGLVGATGTGKTTVVDLLLGLLRPTAGAIEVDGDLLSDALAPRWRKRCGYVPQDVFLSDDTIASNIAFGIPGEEIDTVAVREAAAVAQIDGFVAGLPDGYDTRVGERGVRLSGGQRQRLGIARALYHDPDLLVMDEATNALDSLTETAVIDTIHRLARRKTLVVIAHRLSTIRDCDRIYLMAGGRIVANGLFDELLEREPGFRAMVGEDQ